MVRKAVAILVCLSLILCAFGAVAEETVSPEVVIGQLGKSAVQAAYARGEAVDASMVMSLENGEALGAEFAAAHALFSAMLYTWKTQLGENSGLITYGFSAKDEEIASLDLSVFGDVIYAKSGLWDDVTYKLSIGDAAEQMMALMPDEYSEQYGAGLELGMQISEKLADPAVWQPYIDVIQAWGEQNFELTQTSITPEEASEIGAPNAVTLSSFEITGPSLQSLVDALLSVLVTDDNMLGIVAQAMDPTGSPESVAAVKDTIVQFQAMAGAILGGMLKPIIYEEYLDESGDTVACYLTAGMIVSETQSVDITLSFTIDDVTFDFTNVSASAILDLGDGTVFDFSTSTLVGETTESDGTYTHGQTSSISINVTAEGEKRGLFIKADTLTETSAAHEVITYDIGLLTFGDVSGEWDVVSFIGDESFPITGMHMTIVETTDVTDTGFVTVVDESMRYDFEDDSDASFPIFRETITMKNVPAEPLAEPADAIDVLTLTDEQWEAIGVTVTTKLEELSAKMIELFPELQRQINDALVAGETIEFEVFDQQITPTDGKEADPSGN